MLFRKRGGIIFVASSVAYSPVPGWSHYAATKSYVRFLSEGLWREFRPRGVDVLALVRARPGRSFRRQTGIRVAPGAMTAHAVVTKALRRSVENL